MSIARAAGKSARSRFRLKLPPHVSLDEIHRILVLFREGLADNLKRWRNGAPREAGAEFCALIEAK